MTKRCSRCVRNKNLSKFSKNKTRKDGYQHVCNDCKLELLHDYLSRNPWMKSYYKAQARCNQRRKATWKYYGGKGVKFNLTKEEIKLLWFRDKAATMRKPSLYRLNNDGNYEFNNCRFIEHHLNCQRNGRNFSLLLIDSDNNILARYVSLREAIRNTSFGRYAISQSVHGNKFIDKIKFIKEKDYGRK